MNVLNLQGLTTSTGIEKLIAVFGYNFFIYNSSFNTFSAAGIPVTNSQKKVSSDVFLDKAYFTFGYTKLSAGTLTAGDTTKRYDGSAWRDEEASNKVPPALYIKQANDRLYLGNLYFRKNDESHSSRVWYCDLPENRNITWGFDEGTSLNGTKDDIWVYSSNQTENINFNAHNIKIGDPIYIADLDKVYHVSSILMDKGLQLTEPLSDNITNSNFWVGSNYFDVASNDGDVITGLGENNTRLLAFKRNSVWRYDTASLRKIQGVPGTTSHESIETIKAYTYYFHDSGIWRTDGTSSQLISRPVQDYIDGISPDNYQEIIAWSTGPSKEVLRIYLGDVKNSDTGIDITDCILDYDTATESWTPGQLPMAITAKTNFTQTNVRNVYLGSDISQVYLDGVGNTDAGTSITFLAETGWHLPTNGQTEIEYDKFQVFTKNGRGVHINYKLYGTPFKADKQWQGLGDIKDSVTEFKLKGNNIGRGFKLQFSQTVDDKPPLIEKVLVYMKPVTQRSL